MEKARKPYWLWPNLLSLDAPAVALAWLCLLSKCWAMYHPAVVYWVLGLAVWAVYVIDRVFDATVRGLDRDQLEERHRFHLEHRKWLVSVALCAGLLATGLALCFISRVIIGYAIVGGLLTLAFFAVALFGDREKPVSYLKNAIAGMTFAYGTGVAVQIYMPSHEWLGMLPSREILCFGVLCTLNISAIDLWEHARKAADPEIKAGDELALTLPLVFLGALALLFALLDTGMTVRPFYYAILLGAALLQILNRMRARFSPQQLRVLADAAMLVPVAVFLPFAQ